MTGGYRRTFVTPFAIDLPTALGPLGRGLREPTIRVSSGELWRAQHTPCGPATVHLRVEQDRCTVQARAWGEGAEWSLDHAPELVGAADDPDEFQPADAVVRGWWESSKPLRLGRTVAVYDLAASAVIEQRVTGREARRTWHTLIRRYGDPAPGPGGERPLGLRMFPRPEVVAALGDAARRAVGLELRRGVALSAVAADARGLDRAATCGVDVLDRRLCALPGVGVWTSGYVRAHALGDADAVPVGDWHIPRAVVAALTGAHVSRHVADERMLELLEPFRPHRYRVVRLALAAGGQPARRMPRAEIPDLLAKEASGRPYVVRRTLRFLPGDA